MNYVIRVVSLKTQTVSTLCGTPKVKGYEDGLPHQAKFTVPRGLALDSLSKFLYVADGNHVVRKVSLSKEIRVNTLCGSEWGLRDGLQPLFQNIMGIVVDNTSQALYLMDHSNNRIRKVIDRTRQTTVEGSKS